MEELFSGMPRARAYFEKLDQTIKKNEGSEGVQELIEKREALLDRARKIDRIDLEILYYLHSVTPVTPLRILNGLRDLFDAQEELKKVFDVENLRP